ncbi:hypothetical protein DH2020_047280 [Rehmannia glutinosa]|uniref:Uncharacterized protein n=1 Tax=Rehmannia glutinosa TaxID=99300 RepID=A0ABR0U9H3_REHGL
MNQFYMTTLSVSVLLISIIWYIKSLRKTPPLPPGPRGLPILGYLPFLGKHLLHQFTDLGHKYGPIYKLYLGNKLWVVISSPSLVKEVVRDQDAVFANRDSPVAALVGTYGGNDIAWSPYNSQWRAMRKIFVQEMMNNRSLKESYSLRKDEVRKTITHVHTKVGKPVDIGELSFRTELNVIRNMLWGGIIEGEEGKRIGAEFRVLISKIVDLFGKPNISDFYPVLAGLDIQGVKKNRWKIICNPWTDTVSGGTDTTATTVEWAMAELMKNPDSMAKAHKELFDVVGSDNMIEESHMPDLKYLEAVIKETLRLHPAVPLLIPRSPAKSSTIGGYTIPKNSTVLINVWSIQRDPSIWDNPDEFKPERFLDDNGNLDFKGNHFHYLPFGSGRRVCAGMPLAERMLIYLVASLVHSFEWKLPTEGETLDMSERFGIVLKKSTPLFAVPTIRLHDSNLYM